MARVEPSPTRRRVEARIPILRQDPEDKPSAEEIRAPQDGGQHKQKFVTVPTEIVDRGIGLWQESPACWFTVVNASPVGGEGE